VSGAATTLATFAIPAVGATACAGPYCRFSGRGQSGSRCRVNPSPRPRLSPTRRSRPLGSPDSAVRQSGTNQMRVDNVVYTANRTRLSLRLACTATTPILNSPAKRFRGERLERGRFTRIAGGLPV
jgi:hypothetical protein